MNATIQNILEQIGILHKRNQIISDINIKILTSTPTPTSTPSHKPIHKPPGLKNLGATCFHNSAIQLFYRMSDVVDYVTSDVIYDAYENNNPFKTYIDLLKLMKTKTQNEVIDSSTLSTIVPKTCKVLKKGYTGNHEDAQEFLNGILDQMSIGIFPKNDPRTFLLLTEQKFKCNLGIQLSGKPYFDELKNFSKGYPSATNKGDAKWIKIELNDIAVDQYIATIHDLENKFNTCVPIMPITSKMETMLRLDFDSDTHETINAIVQKNITTDYSNTNNYGLDYNLSKQTGTLYAKKRNYIPGKYIIIHLKAFSSNFDGSIVSKKSHNINFSGDIVFDFTENDISKQTTYELIGTVNHYGALNNGHYNAYIKYDQWYCYDDHNVFKNIPNTSSIYMALYCDKSKM